MLSPVVPEAFNIAAFLLDCHLSEARAKKPAVYCEYQPLTYAEMAQTTHLAGNGLLGLGVELETRPIIRRHGQWQSGKVYVGGTDGRIMMPHRYQVRIHARMPEFWKAEDLEMERREVPLLWGIALRNRHVRVLQNLLGREEAREITKV